jgi:hypothetical protein
MPLSTPLGSWLLGGQGRSTPRLQPLSAKVMERMTGS